MSLLRIGPRPKSDLRAVRWPAMLLVLAAGGCGSPSTTGPTVGLLVAGPVQDAPPRIFAPRVEMEDDGREAQVPPPRRIRAAPDDPTEPFSPNYGAQPAVTMADAVPAVGALPQDLPHDFRRRLVSAIRTE